VAGRAPLGEFSHLGPSQLWQFRTVCSPADEVTAGFASVVCGVGFGAASGYVAHGLTRHLYEA
jgi:hypothetical protein